MNNHILKLGIVLILLSISISVNVYTYTVEVNEEVHQYITNESSTAWKLIPYEINDNLENPILNAVNLNYDVINIEMNK